MLSDDVARPQYHKARLGTRSSGGAHSFAVASAARAVTADSLHRVEFQVWMEPIQQQVKELLQGGSCSTHSKTRHTCQNILKLWESLWTFVRVEGVEPTNNNAERPLRRAVIWRRKSFGAQSESGSRFVERILTVVTTLRQQGRDVLGYLTTVCTVASVSASSPCLLSDSS
jgi:transposase